jgi:hypothetical protein
MLTMKRFFLAVVCAFAFVMGMAQTKFAAVDKSPMDISFYPANYPILKIQDKATEPLLARVVYSRPQKNGRTVFGELVEFNTVWRLGANEATEIEFFKDVKLGNTKLKKGRYSLYAIPTVENWTIILNRETDIWGAFKYDQKKDALRTVIPTQKQTESTEVFSMQFEKNGTGFNLVIAWDDVLAKLPISL